MTTEPPQDNVVAGVTKVSNYIDRYTGEVLYSARLNPNKFIYGDTDYISQYGIFKQAMQEMLYRKNIIDYKIKRVDFRIDSYDYTFSELYKLNYALINIFAAMNGIDNCYESKKNGIIHNIKYQNKRIQGECYDRITKDGCGIAKTRIEFRKIMTYSDLADISQLYIMACSLLNMLNNKLISNYYDTVQNKRNDDILREYSKGHTHSMSELINVNRDWIFTSKQLVNLCKSLGLADSTAYTYQHRLCIDFYSCNNLRIYMQKVAEAIDGFIKS